MKYTIDNNVEIVKGAKNSCIYNMNTRKLYVIDAVFEKMLNDLLLINGGELNKSSQEILNKLVYEKIFVDEHNLSSKINRNFSNEISFAWIEITQNCNLRCKHCYENAEADMQKDSMSIPNFYKVIDCLKKGGIRNIQLIGGEPFLHKDIDKMIEICKNEFDYIEIFTNGTLLNDSMFQKIKEGGIKLAFSLYSERENVHESVTKIKGSFKSTYNNIRQARKMGIECRVASVEMINVPEFKLKSIDVFHQSDLPRMAGKANINLYDRNMLHRKLITKKSFSKLIDVKRVYNNMQRHNCFGNKIYIDVNLNVFPCVMERRFLHGNIQKNELNNIINPQIIGLNKDKIDECNVCEFRYACYDCRPDSITTSKLSKPWFCTYNPQAGNWVNEEKYIDELIKIYKRG